MTTIRLRSIVGGAVDVLAGDTLIGQVGLRPERSILRGSDVVTEPARWAWRDLHHTRYGDAPGQPRGWTGAFDRRRDAVAALVTAAAIPEPVEEHPPEDVVGLAEIADRAQVRPDTVDTWTRRHPGFPAPVAHLAQGRVWRWVDVAQWLARPRRPGRPRTTSPRAD